MRCDARKMARQTNKPSLWTNYYSCEERKTLLNDVTLNDCNIAQIESVRRGMSGGDLDGDKGRRRSERNRDRERGREREKEREWVCMYVCMYEPRKDRSRLRASTLALFPPSQCLITRDQPPTTNPFKLPSRKRRSSLQLPLHPSTPPPLHPSILRCSHHRHRRAQQGRRCRLG